MTWNLDLKHFGEILNPLTWVHKEPVQIDFFGYPSDKFRRSVEQTYREIPREFRDYVRSKGGVISAGQVMTDMVPPDEAVLDVSNTDGRTHVNQYHGINDAKTHIALIAEYSLWTTEENPSERTREWEASLRANPSAKPDPKKWEPHINLPGGVREEFFHMFDACIHPTMRMSEVPSFRDAYDADIAALGGVEQAGRIWFMDYLVKSKHDDNAFAGRSEAFAYLASHQVGGGDMTWLAAACFPRTNLWMQEFHAGFKKNAYNQKSLEHFIGEFGANRVLPPDTLEMTRFRQEIAFAIKESASMGEEGRSYFNGHIFGHAYEGIPAPKRAQTIKDVEHRLGLA